MCIRDSNGAVRALHPAQANTWLHGETVGVGILMQMRMNGDGAENGMRKKMCIRDRLYTIPLALNKFVLEDGVDYPGMMAVAASGILPIILVFACAQKYIIESVASSGIKG